MELKGFLILLEYFFPLFGIVAIAVLAGIYKGWKKWLVLIFGPVILFGAQTLFLRFDIIEGNLLTVSVYGLMIMGMWYYYIILLFAGIYQGWKYWKE